MVSVSTFSLGGDDEGFNGCSTSGGSVFLGAVTAASAGTIATFADPSPSGANPLFELDGFSFTGEWKEPGLTLLMPITGQVYPNATFEMTGLTWNGTTGLTGGTLTFYDAAQVLVLQIDFDAAWYFGPFGFGATDLAGQMVTMTGPGLPAGLYEESFAFSFANQATTPTGFTWTASFTSSAIPEPTSLSLLGLGLMHGLTATARRR